jgi:transcriptional regulator with XRE-family HTH domain
MNLHATIPLDEVSATPAADDPVARMLADARLADENALLDALEARRVELGLSHASLNQLSGLPVGYAAKLLSPGRSKSPSLVTLDRIMATLGLSWVLVIDPEKVSRISPSWRPRDEGKVRLRRLSPKVLERARPHVIAELARRAARPRWANIPAREFMRSIAEQSQ